MTQQIKTEILIVGGGAAGLAAAAAATGRRIAIVDDNPRLGGQIWRAELGRIKSPEALELIARIDRNDVAVINNATVFGRSNDRTLLAETSDGIVELEFEKLIIATGARERFLPFPGWTLPNVFGAGGLQALVKGGLNVENKKVVIAGTGPLLLAVADYLKSKGARVLMIAEQASRANLIRFGLGLWSHPGKIAQAFALKRRLAGVKIKTGSWIVAVEGNEKVECVRLNGIAEPIACDYLASGFHLVANTELAAMLGCEIENDLVKVDEFQRTSLSGVFCAGEPTGIGGVELALIEGRIAGLAAAERLDGARRLFGQRSGYREFAASLDRCFELREELKGLPDAETIVCRCEDVKLAELEGFVGFRDAKLQTRCGMGPCQGRVCGAATRFLFGWKPDAVRPPIYPVRVESLSAPEINEPQ
ncbi:MAG: NAD(P)/FAD-dependent oxidoreductase [Acidobacteria bacterium]|nr:NAD(P)/FAD-dependent oxidoreductase [Acidobacteriota bacterium]